MTRLLLLAVASVATVVILVEVAYRVAQAEYQRSDDGDDGRCIVLVLGYPTESDGRPHPVQLFRVRAGVRALRDNQCHQIVFSGAAVTNEHVEAESMANIARSLGVVASEIILESRARTTWENIGCSAPHLEKMDRVLVVSDSLHVRRAKRYACLQSRSLCTKVVAVGANPPIDLMWWKVPASIHELRARLVDSLIHQPDAAGASRMCPSR